MSTTYSQDERDVIAAVERMTTAFHAADIEGVMASYEPTATIVFQPGTPSSDPAAIRDGFGGFFALAPTFTYSGHEVVIAGDTAVHFAPWTMKGTAPDGSEILQHGLSVAVLRRQADGGWRMVIDNPFGQHLLDEAGYPA